MKNNLKINTIFLLLLTIASQQVKAQKFGHVNSGNLLTLMPSTIQSDQQLKVYRDSLVKVGEGRAQALKAEFDAFLAKYNEGSLTPIQAQQTQGELQQKEQQLIAYQDEINNMVAIKRQELLEPIIDQLSKAIEEVGQEGAYTMIFDTSVFNSIVFARDADDLTNQVKAKLNLE